MKFYRYFIYGMSFYGITCTLTYMQSWDSAAFGRGFLLFGLIGGLLTCISVAAGIILFRLYKGILCGIE